MSAQILILSQSHLEGSTDHVCQWLSHLRIPFLRLNGEDLCQLQRLTDLPANENIAAVWYRRKIHSFPAQYQLKKADFNTEYTLKRFLIDEFNGLHSYLFHLIDRHKWLNDPFTEDSLNKLQVLALARKCSIHTPFTEVVTTKKEIESLLNTYPEIIVKPISECIFLEDAAGGQYKMLTKTIHHANLHLVPENFFPSLVQEKVEKKFEIRAFYLNGEWHAMAIFSQNNQKTREDFRNYDTERPNRTVPYQLPATLEAKLHQLMKLLHFRTGSVDLMVDKQGNYYFLEINPEGQFGMVSYPCNYYLEKKLAILLGESIQELEPATL
ncbi:grasp-with-spasm system ATP-grasp peptide maturase [Chitinophaga jiangningensis]|nr:grasp-with-spasm system ATP-grasp peptide maturase [Chitinophaga jiangningensis]